MVFTLMIWFKSFFGKPHFQAPDFGKNKDRHHMILSRFCIPVSKYMFSNFRHGFKVNNNKTRITFWCLCDLL